MKKFSLALGTFSLLVACASTGPKAGMSWDDFYTAKARLVVSYNVADVTGCEEVGPVQAIDYDDMLTAKGKVEELAVLKGGDTLLFTKLENNRNPHRWSPFPNMREQHIATGMVYRCNK